VFLNRAFSHVYGRIARGGRIFAEDGESARFVSIVRDVERRDGLTILARCVMPTHRDLAVGAGEVLLFHPPHSLRRSTTRHVSLRRHVLGPARLHVARLAP